jgi:hypothetical protein
VYYRNKNVCSRAHQRSLAPDCGGGLWSACGVVPLFVVGSFQAAAGCGSVQLCTRWCSLLPCNQRHYFATRTPRRTRQFFAATWQGLRYMHTHACVRARAVTSGGIASHESLSHHMIRMRAWRERCSLCLHTQETRRATGRRRGLPVAANAHIASPTTHSVLQQQGRSGATRETMRARVPVLAAAPRHTARCQPVERRSSLLW